MTIEPTTDAALIRSVLAHPKIWPHITNDFSMPVDEFEPVMSDAVLYLAAKDGDELLGLWVLVQQDEILWSVHTALLPNSWGPRAAQATQEMLSWLWSHTTCRRLTTVVPSYNRLALRFAEAAGMRQYGRNEKSYLKRGTLWDLIELGLSKEN